VIVRRKNPEFVLASEVDDLRRRLNRMELSRNRWFARWFRVYGMLTEIEALSKFWQDRNARLTALSYERDQLRSRVRELEDMLRRG
jgi:acyl carrier protein phosphodiesterase